MNLEEKELSRKYYFKGRIIKVREDCVRLPDGKDAKREVVEHPGGVSVVAVTDDNEILAVRQFRYPYKEVLLEIPAGKFDFVGEDPETAVRRELREETGATADTLIKLGVIYPSPGCYGENLHLFAAKGLHFGETDPDDDEFLEVERVPLKEFSKLVMDGKIKDAKTEIGILKIEKLINEGKF